MEEKHLRFFPEQVCEFYPCHPGRIPRPLAACSATVPCTPWATGGGSFPIRQRGSRTVPNCLRPHVRENYGKIFGEDAGDLELAKKKKGRKPVHNCRHRAGPVAKVAGQNPLLQPPVEPGSGLTALQQALLCYAFDYDATLFYKPLEYGCDLSSGGACRATICRHYHLSCH